MSRSDLRDELQAALSDGYVIQRELSGGGMSRVFLTRDTHLQRDVIVKVLTPELAEGVNLERFEREIRMLAHLQHPHIVPLLSAGRVGSLPLYTMPFVSGESARARLASGPLSIADATAIMRDVARALEFAHSEGIVHRDIKPDNILISGNASVVADFGIAKAVTDAMADGSSATLTRAGMSVGTPAYMPPEQAVAEHVDQRADIYSLGATVYELLAGAPPFGGGSAQAVIRGHMSEVPQPLVQRRPDVPAPLADLIMRCLEKDPGRRPASARELLTALEHATSAEQPAVRRRRVGMIAALILFAAMTAGAIGWSIAKRGPRLGPAVAVLPFESIGGDTASEYFADGMTEQLVSDLGRANGLRVASRGASFAYKGKRVDPTAAASALHVNAIVTGSVRRSGTQLRIEAQLVPADGGPAIWSDRFDRTLDDVFAVQEEIARNITSALKVSLTPASRARSTTGVTYDLYLRGTHFRRARFTRENLDSAIAMMRAALARDSTYAPAWAGLSDAYRLMSEFVAPLTVLPRAREAARKAAALDPSDAAAGVALANIIFNVDWNWAAAEREYRRVLAVHPEYAAAHRDFAFFLLASRRYDETVEHLRAADLLEWRQQVDTIGLRSRQLTSLGRVKAAMGDTLAARRLFDESLRLSAASWSAHWTYGLSTIHYDAALAVKHLEQVRATIGDQLPQLTHLGVAYGRAGQHDKAREIIAAVEARARTRYVPKDQLFVLYLSIGERATALRWLRQAIEEHHYWLPYLNANPMVEGIRNDPEYRALMQRIGVPQSAL